MEVIMQHIITQCKTPRTSQVPVDKKSDGAKSGHPRPQKQESLMKLSAEIFMHATEPERFRA